MSARDWADRVQAARRALAPILTPTPLVRVELEGFPAPTFLKLETVLPTGSFKVRGALAAVAASVAEGGRPVVTASAGNHGLGLAFAAVRFGTAAAIVVPETASAAKVAALRRFPVELQLIGQSYEQAETAALRLAEERGARFVSAYSDWDVIAGQSTIVAEVDAVLADPFQIVVPVGGGGLASGTVLAAPARARVLGVESAVSRAVSASMTAGHVVDVEVGPTLADGLAGNLARDALTPGILARSRVDIVSVDESEIGEGIRTLALRHGIVAEGAGAVGVGAALAGAVPEDRPTVFVITGRNIDAALLNRVLSP